MCESQACRSWQYDVFSQLCREVGDWSVCLPLLVSICLCVLIVAHYRSASQLCLTLCHRFVAYVFLGNSSPARWVVCTFYHLQQSQSPWYLSLKDRAIY
jgi:hypothetical protein